MNDLISRKALIAEYDRVHIGPPGGARKLMEDAPAVDAVEVVHGRWIEVRGILSVNRKDVPVVKCSKCEIYFCDIINNHHYMYHYCPNCGAKMDGDWNG